MSSFNLLLEGFATALTLTNLMYGLIGTFLGTLVGVLPGIGPALAIAFSGALPNLFSENLTNTALFLLLLNKSVFLHGLAHR